MAVSADRRPRWVLDSATVATMPVTCSTAYCGALLMWTVCKSNRTLAYKLISVPTAPVAVLLPANFDHIMCWTTLVFY